MSGLKILATAAHKFLILFWTEEENEEAEERQKELELLKTQAAKTIEEKEKRIRRSVPTAAPAAAPRGKSKPVGGDKGGGAKGGAGGGGHVPETQLEPYSESKADSPAQAQRMSSLFASDNADVPSKVPDMPE